jgi:hypothetical protein
MSAESSLANERRHHEAAAQAAESAELLLAKVWHQHKAAELATMSAIRSLTDSQDRPLAAMLTEPPALGDKALRHVQAACGSLAMTPCPGVGRRHGGGIYGWLVLRLGE